MDMCEVTRFWNNKESAFDVFDDFQPDVFLTHYLMLTKDIAKRLKGENIKTVINVTGAVQQHLDIIDEMLDNYYCFQNYSILPDVDVIAPCTDIYLEKNPRLDMPAYAIETLFLVDAKEDLVDYRKMFEARETYHVLTTNKALAGEPEVDSFVSVAVLSKLYENYEEIFVRRPSQVFYDAAYYGPGCNLLENTQSSVFLKKEVVKTSHSPYNRVSALLEKIGENTDEEK